MPFCWAERALDSRDRFDDEFEDVEDCDEFEPEEDDPLCTCYWS